MSKTGTNEWADVNKNFLKGCNHNCLYCYARSMAKRFKRVKDADEWGTPKFLQNKFDEKPKLYKDKRIMFPTTHDILPEYIEQTVVYLRKWLEVGNHILIVSKPHFECIKRICDELVEYKDQIVFRFTIGSIEDYVLNFWEPGAPGFEERVKCLRYAFGQGYQTSVSCEPFLDSGIRNLISIISPYVTDTIWVGKMNRISNRVDISNWKHTDIDFFLNHVKRAQTDDEIKYLYHDYKDNPKIKWKDSIKKVLGLPEEQVG